MRYCWDIIYISYGFQYQNVFIDPRAEIQICTGGGIGEGAGVVYFWGWTTAPGSYDSEMDLLVSRNSHRMELKII